MPIYKNILIDKADRNMTLGEMISALKTCQNKLRVEFVNGGHPTNFHSYRGYYRDLAFERIYNEDIAYVTVEHFLEACLSCVGTIFPGWKGGDFIMDETTKLWVATEGKTSGIGPIKLLRGRSKVFIITSLCEDQELEY